MDWIWLDSIGFKWSSVLLDWVSSGIFGLCLSLLGSDCIASNWTALGWIRLNQLVLGWVSVGHCIGFIVDCGGILWCSCWCCVAVGGWEVGGGLGRGHCAVGGGGDGKGGRVTGMLLMLVSKPTRGELRPDFGPALLGTRVGSFSCRKRTPHACVLSCCC